MEGDCKMKVDRNRLLRSDDMTVDATRVAEPNSRKINAIRSLQVCTIIEQDLALSSNSSSLNLLEHTL
jgi:hypothetical protein